MKSMKQFLVKFAAAAAMLLFPFLRLEAKADSKTSLIRLEKPVEVRLDQKNPKNPVELLLQKNFSGRFVYSFADPISHNLMWLVFYSASQAVVGSDQGSSRTAKMYPIRRAPFSPNVVSKSDTYISDPLISPNGRYILFKYAGLDDMLGSYLLYVLDTQSSKITRVSEKILAYALVSWSPDSNYITFVGGGDYQGNTTFVMPNDELELGPLKLYVCNWRTSQHYLVATNNTVTGPFAWQSPHTLVYGVLPQSPQKETATHPNIYGYSTEGRKSNLLISNGYRPTPSPDGNMVVFFGPENPEGAWLLKENWQQQPRNVALSVAQNNGKGRIAFNPISGKFPFIIWLPDNLRFLELRQIGESPNAKLEVREWNTKTQQFRVVGALEAKDSQPYDASPVDPQFRPLSVSEDGNKLFLAVKEIVGRKNRRSLITATSVKSIDIASGDVELLMQVRHDLGFDWRPS